MTFKNDTNDNPVWLPERNRDRFLWSKLLYLGSLLRTDQSHCSALGNRLFLWKQSHPTQKLQISFLWPFTHWCFGLLRCFDTPLSPFSTLWPLSIISTSFLKDQMLVSDAPIYLCRHGLSVLTQTLLIAQSTAISFSPCHGMKYLAVHRTNNNFVK